MSNNHVGAAANELVLMRERVLVEAIEDTNPTFAVELVLAFAARVEQDIRRQQREAVEAVIQAELDLHQCSFDELPVANQRFVQGMRRALEWMARGGSDVG